MRLQIALPASALLLAISAAVWVRAPQTSAPSPRKLVARAGLGAIGAIVGAGERRVAPEATLSPAPITLSASRPDSVDPDPTPVEVEAIERYHERALESARAKSALVVADGVAGAGVKSLAVAEFEKKCEKAAIAAPKKPKCTKASLSVPIVGCYLKQAASVLVS